MNISLLILERSRVKQSIIIRHIECSQNTNDINPIHPCRLRSPKMDSIQLQIFKNEQVFICTEDRKLGFFSVVFLIVNAVMGTGIFSTPSIVFKTVNNVGSALMLWLTGAILTLCGFVDIEMITNCSLLVYLEYGLAIPKSGGDKNYVCTQFFVLIIA